LNKNASIQTVPFAIRTCIVLSAFLVIPSFADIARSAGEDRPLLAGYYNLGAFFGDQIAPPVLTAFSGATGSGSGEIDLTITFPSYTGDYKTVVIRRLDGATAPNAGCSNGSAIKTYNSPTFSNDYTDTGTGGSYYSFRACLYDWAGNLTSSQTATNIQAESGCGGVSVGGYCWYYGDLGDSCDTTCTGNGGCDLVGTRDYSGSGGNLTQCVAVLDALGRGVGLFPDSDFALGAGLGCDFYNDAGDTYRERDTGATTPCSASDGGSRRACACDE